MTFQLDAEEYYRMYGDIPEEKKQMLYVIYNIVYWYPEIKDRLSDAERIIFDDVFKSAVQIIKRHEENNN